MDLEVPPTFEPVNADGEAESFQLVPIEQLKELIISPEFKFNCALVCLDFLIRHGHIHPDDGRNEKAVMPHIILPINSVYIMVEN